MSVGVATCHKMAPIHGDIAPLVWNGKIGPQGWNTALWTNHSPDPVSRPGKNRAGTCMKMSIIVYHV